MTWAKLIREHVPDKNSNVLPAEVSTGTYEIRDLATFRAGTGHAVYIMVDSVAATIEKITANGGEIAQPIGGDAPEITARFRDPAGNVIGVFQRGG